MKRKEKKIVLSLMALYSALSINPVIAADKDKNNINSDSVVVVDNDSEMRTDSNCSNDCFQYEYTPLFINFGVVLGAFINNSHWDNPNAKRIELSEKPEYGELEIILKDRNVSIPGLPPALTGLPSVNAPVASVPPSLLISGVIPLIQSALLPLNSSVSSSAFPSTYPLSSSSLSVGMPLLTSSSIPSMPISIPLASYSSISLPLPLSLMFALLSPVFSSSVVPSTAPLSSSGVPLASSSTSSSYSLSSPLTPILSPSFSSTPSGDPSKSISSVPSYLSSVPLSSISLPMFTSLSAPLSIPSWSVGAPLSSSLLSSTFPLWSGPAISLGISSAPFSLSSSVISAPSLLSSIPLHLSAISIELSSLTTPITIPLALSSITLSLPSSLSSLGLPSLSSSLSLSSSSTALSLLPSSLAGLIFSSYVVPSSVLLFSSKPSLFGIATYISASLGLFVIQPSILSSTLSFPLSTMSSAEASLLLSSLTPSVSVSFISASLLSLPSVPVLSLSSLPFSISSLPFSLSTTILGLSVIPSVVSFLAPINIQLSLSSATSSFLSSGLTSIGVFSSSEFMSGISSASLILASGPLITFSAWSWIAQSWGLGVFGWGGFSFIFPAIPGIISASTFFTSMVSTISSTLSGPFSSFFASSPILPGLSLFGPLSSSSFISSVPVSSVASSSASSYPVWSSLAPIGSSLSLAATFIPIIGGFAVPFTWYATSLILSGFTILGGSVAISGAMNLISSGSGSLSLTAIPSLLSLQSSTSISSVFVPIVSSIALVGSSFSSVPLSLSNIFSSTSLSLPPSYTSSGVSSLIAAVPSFFSGISFTPSLASVLNPSALSLSSVLFPLISSSLLLPSSIGTIALASSSFSLLFSLLPSLAGIFPAICSVSSTYVPISLLPSTSSASISLLLPSNSLWTSSLWLYSGPNYSLSSISGVTSITSLLFTSIPLFSASIAGLSALSLASLYGLSASSIVSSGVSSFLPLSTSIISSSSSMSPFITSSIFSLGYSTLWAGIGTSTLLSSITLSLGTLLSLSSLPFVPSIILSSVPSSISGGLLVSSILSSMSVVSSGLYSSLANIPFGISSIGIGIAFSSFGNYVSSLAFSAGLFPALSFLLINFVNPAYVSLLPSFSSIMGSSYFIPASSSAFPSAISSFVSLSSLSSIPPFSFIPFLSSFPLSNFSLAGISIAASIWGSSLVTSIPSFISSIPSSIVSIPLQLWYWIVANFIIGVPIGVVAAAVLGGISVSGGGAVFGVALSLLAGSSLFSGTIFFIPPALSSVSLVSSSALLLLPVFSGLSLFSSVNNSFLSLPASLLSTSSSILSIPSSLSSIPGSISVIPSLISSIPVSSMSVSSSLAGVSLLTQSLSSAAITLLSSSFLTLSSTLSSSSIGIPLSLISTPFFSSISSSFAGLSSSFLPLLASSSNVLSISSSVFSTVSSIPSAILLPIASSSSFVLSPISLMTSIPGSIFGPVSIGIPSSVVGTLSHTLALSSSAPFSLNPSTSSVSNPSSNPSSAPSSNPISAPFSNPSLAPISNPSLSWSTNPSVAPSSNPITSSSINPSSTTPSTNPSTASISNPSSNPSSAPLSNPSLSWLSNPSSAPFSNPSSAPFSNPISAPFSNPLSSWSTNPSSMLPSSNPSASVSNPSSNPITAPLSNPSLSSLSNPISVPLSNPSSAPFSNPSSNPSISSLPSVLPSVISGAPQVASMLPSALPGSAGVGARIIGPKGMKVKSPKNYGYNPYVWDKSNEFEFRNVVTFGDSLSDTGSFGRSSIYMSDGNPFVFYNNLLSIFLTGKVTVPETFGGTNYARSGAIVKPQKKSLISLFADPSDALGLRLDVAKQIKWYLSDNGGHADKDSIYLLWIGGNDMTGDIMKMALNVPKWGKILNSPHYYNDKPTVAAEYTQYLADKGAGNIILMNLPDPGITPFTGVLLLSQLDGGVGMLTDGTIFERFNLGHWIMGKHDAFLRNPANLVGSPEGRADEYSRENNINAIKSYLPFVPGPLVSLIYGKIYDISKNAQRHMVKQWNYDLLERFKEVKSEGNLIYADIYRLFDEVQNDPTAYGIDNILVPETELGWTSPGSDEGDFYYHGDDGKTYMYTDWHHPSGFMHGIMAEYILSILQAPGYTTALSKGLEVDEGARKNFVSGQLKSYRNANFGVGEYEVFAGLFTGYSRDGRSLYNRGLGSQNLGAGIIYRVANGLDIGGTLSFGYDKKRKPANTFNYKSFNESATFFAQYVNLAGFWVNGTATLGKQQIKDINRLVQLGKKVRHETGSTSGTTTGLTVSVGYDIPLDFGCTSCAQYTLTPYVETSLTKYKVKGYSEKGETSTAMEFSSQNRTAKVLTTGVQFSSKASNVSTNLDLALNFKNKSDKDKIIASGIVKGSGLSPVSRVGNGLSKEKNIWLSVTPSVEYKISDNISAYGNVGYNLGNGAKRTNLNTTFGIRGRF